MRQLDPPRSLRDHWGNGFNNGTLTGDRVPDASAADVVPQCDQVTNADQIDVPTQITIFPISEDLVNKFRRPFARCQ